MNKVKMQWATVFAAGLALATVAYYLDSDALGTAAFAIWAPAIVVMFGIWRKSDTEITRIRPLILPRLAVAATILGLIMGLGLLAGLLPESVETERRDPCDNVRSDSAADACAERFFDREENFP